MNQGALSSAITALDFETIPLFAAAAQSVTRPRHRSTQLGNPAFAELKTNLPRRWNAQQMLRSSLSSPRFRAQVTGGLRYGALKQSF